MKSPVAIMPQKVTSDYGLRGKRPRTPSPKTPRRPSKPKPKPKGKQIKQPLARPRRRFFEPPETPQQSLGGEDEDENKEENDEAVYQETMKTDLAGAEETL